MSTEKKETHSLFVGYFLWVFGFTGAHRFYYGKKLTGLLWLVTGGLLGVGWLIDLLLIPGMNEYATKERSYIPGVKDYNLTWILQSYLGIFGVHRMYLGKIISGVLYLFTAGFFGIGWAMDFWNLNEMIEEANAEARS